MQASASMGKTHNEHAREVIATAAASMKDGDKTVVVIVIDDAGGVRLSWSSGGSLEIAGAVAVALEHLTPSRVTAEERARVEVGGKVIN
jgi:hypothetical protein